MAPKAKPEAGKDSKAPKKEEEKVSAKEMELRTREKELEKRKVARPDRDNFQQEVATMQVEITNIQTKLNEIKEQVEEKAGGREEFQRKRDLIKERLDDHQKICDEHDHQIEQCKKGMDKDKTERQAAKADHDTMKKKLGYETMEEIDGRIAQIEWEMRHSSLAPKDERDKVKEIQELKARKPQLKKFAQLTAGSKTTDVSGMSDMKARLDMCWAQLKEARANKSKVSAEYKALMDARNKAYEGMPHLFADRQALQTKMQTKIAERNALRDSFRENQNLFYAYSTEVREIRQERQREQWESDKVSYEKRRLEREAVMEEDTPMLEELTLVDQVITYVQTLKPKEAAQEETEATADINVPKGTTAMMSKKDRDEVFYYAPTKAGKKGKGKKKEQATIKHNIGSLALFAEIKVAAPLTVSSVDATLASLEEKKLAFLAKQAQIIEERKTKKATRAAAAETGEEVAAEA